MSIGETPTLPIDLIAIPELLLRGVDPTDEQFLMLVEDVKANGVQQPIKVREIETETGKKYILVDGRQRLGAAKEARLPEVPVAIETMSDNEAALASIRLNLHRSNPQPAAYGKFLKEYLIRNPATTLSELANELHYTDQWLNDRLRLTNLTGELAKMVDSGEIALVNGIALSKLPQEEQPAFADRAKSLNGMEFGQQVSERLKTLKTAKQKGTTPKEEGFVAQPLLRKRGELQDILAAGPTSTAITGIVNAAGATDAGSAAFAMLNWIFQMDAASLQEREDSWKAEQAARAEERERQKIVREKEKAEAAAAKEAAKQAAAAEKAYHSLVAGN